MSTKKLQLFGLKGKSAYQYAQDGGYTGTEAEFKNKMAGELKVVYDYEDLNEKILATTIKPEVSGEFIHLTDSAALPIMDFGMEGKTEQFTTSGKQLWKHGDVTFVQKGTFDVHLEAGKYTFTAEVTSTDTDAETCLVHIGNNIARGYMQRGSRFSITFELAESIDFVILYASDAMGNGENDTAIFKNVMLNSETTAKPYEPYTGAQPSPNPDYPQEIINAGTYNEATGRYEIGCSVGNKNLFDIDFASDINNWDNTTRPAYYYLPIFIGNGNSFTISFKNTMSLGLGFNFGINADGTKIEVTKWIYHTSESALQNHVYTKTVSADDGYIYLMVNKSAYSTMEAFIENARDNLQIELGLTKTDYVEGKSQPLTLTSPVPLTKWDYLTKRDGIWGWSVWSVNRQLTGSGMSTSITYGWTKFIDSKTPEGIHTYVLSLNEKIKGHDNIFCKTYKLIPGAYGKDAKLNSVSGIVSGQRAFFNTNITTIEEWKAHIDEKPLDVWYQTAEEQSFHPLPDSEQALLRSLETYYQVTNIYNDQNCPMSIQYVADTQTYIDNLSMSLTNAVVSLGGEV